MQNKARLELADYEAENLARLQKMFSRKWEFIFMQVGAGGGTGGGAVMMYVMVEVGAGGCRWWCRCESVDGIGGCPC